MTLPVLYFEQLAEYNASLATREAHEMAPEMATVTAAEAEGFFRDVDEASKKAIWCAVATVERGEPRVRIVHPTWEGQTLWFATGTSSPKVRQLAANPAVDVQFLVSPPEFVHVLVRGRAEIVSDPTEKKRVWDVIDYDLAQFWPNGPDDPEFCPVRLVPSRVELSKLFGMQDKRVWRG
jgi:general stress protein 26